MTFKGTAHREAMHAHSLQICEICGKSLTFAAQMSQDQSEHILCGAFDCKKIMEQKSSMPPALFESQLKFQRKLNEKREANETRLKKRIVELTTREDQEHRQILRYTQGQYQGTSEEQPQLVVIPCGLSLQAPTPAERIKRYLEHLADIITQAAECADIDEIDHRHHQEAHEKLARDAEWFDNYPEQLTVSDQLCTLCKGGCCRDGKEHAYLSAATMRQYMDRHQDLSEIQILQLYLSHLNEESIKDSCINQTSTGCALPRELRSDICNAFYCDPLRSYQRKAGDSEEEEPVLVIQRAATLHSIPDPDVYNDVVDITLLNGSHCHKVAIPK